MPVHFNSTSRSRRVSRRRMLRRGMHGVVLTSVLQPWHAVTAAPPESEHVAVKPTRKRLVYATTSQPIVLTPVSRDFENTVVRAIAADPRGEFIAVAGDDHAIRVLDATSLATVATLQAHTDLIRSMHFAGDGSYLASAGNDGQLIVWDRGQNFKIRQKMQGKFALACARFSPSGDEMAAVGFQNEVYLFGRGKSVGPSRTECECTDLRALAYRPDGKLLVVGGRSGKLHVFDRSSGKLLGDFEAHAGRIHAVEFLEDSSTVASVGEDGRVVLFDTKAMKVRSRIEVADGKLFAICVLDNQHLAVSGSDNLVRLVDCQQERPTEVLRGHTGSVASLAFSGDQLFSGGYDATVRRWQLTGLNGGRERIAERQNPLDR